jgi:hypothetical protein
MFRRLVIAVNNRITRMRRVRVAASEVMLLLPHCLQRTGCDRNLIRGIDECLRCRRCNVPEFIGLKNEMGVRCAVAGGGRQASQLVRDPGVRAVVAVACENELAEGIFAAFPKPVIAVSNECPNGPCRDTCANVGSVRRALESMIVKRG